MVGNLLFGLWESDGWVSREQTGGIRCGFTTTSEQLAHSFTGFCCAGASAAPSGPYDPRSKRPSIVKGRRVQGSLPCWEVRLGGIDNVTRFASALPMWGPKGQALTAELSDPELRKHRGSQLSYLPADQTEPVLEYLRGSRE